MAGSPTFGKISTGMRSTARKAASAMAINATRTVTGRRRAAKTRRMFHLPGNSLAGLREERLDVAGCGGHSKQRAPHAEPGESIIDLGLSQQPLRFGYFVDVPQAG